MPSDKELDRWPELKVAMRRFTTRHRVGLDDIETEKDQIKRMRKNGVDAGYRSYADGQYRQNFDYWRMRQEKYRDYVEMSEDASISGSLDIYADEASQPDQTNNDVVQVEGEDEDVVTELETLLNKNLQMNAKAWDIIRRLCTNGDAPYEIKFRKDFRGVYGIERMDHRRFDRQEEDGKLIGFRMRQAVYDPRRTGKTMYWGNASAAEKGGETSLSPFRAVHWRLPDGSESIYGKSILEAARRTWRQVRLMEDSVVIYRISRGAERRVFYVNVGNLGEDEAEGYIKNLMAKFRKKPFINPRTGEIDEKAHPLAWDEDFFIPIQDNKDNTRIEQLPGGQNMGEIEDLKWFRQKIDAELKIPSSYLSRDGQYDAKAGLSQQDIRFSRTIDRIQRAFIEGLNKICYVHLMLRGFTFKQITSFTLKMTPPSALAELLRIDAINARLESVANARGTEVFPDIYILTEIYGMGEDEANEVLQLKLQQDQQKMQAEAAANAAAGGGAPGGMDGGAMPSGGAPADMGAEGGEGGPQGVDMGEDGAGPQGDGSAPPGTPEMAGVKNKRAITEAADYELAKARVRRASLEHRTGFTRYSQMCENFTAKRRKEVVVKKRHSAFESQFSHGEMGGLKVSMGSQSNSVPIHEALRVAANGRQTKPLTEAEQIRVRESKVQAELKRLINESSAGR